MPVSCRSPTSRFDPKETVANLAGADPHGTGRYAEAVVKTGLETAVVRACRPTTAKSSQPNDCVLEWRIDAANPTAAARTSAKQTREQVCRPRRSPGRPGPAGGRAQAGAARTAITGDHAASAQSRSRWPRSRPPRFSGSTRGSRWHFTQFWNFAYAFLLVLGAYVGGRVLMTAVAGVTGEIAVGVAGFAAGVVISVQDELLVVVERCRFPRLRACGTFCEHLPVIFPVQAVGGRLVAGIAGGQHGRRQQLMLERRRAPSIGVLGGMGGGQLAFRSWCSVFLGALWHDSQRSATFSSACANGLRLSLVSLGPWWSLWQAMQSCSMSSWWNDTLTVRLGIGTPFVVFNPTSATAWHSMQRGVDAPRQTAWQAKQSVANSAWPLASGPGETIRCG